MSSVRKVVLAGEILWTYVFVRRSLRRSDIQAVVGGLRRPPKRATRGETDPRLLGRAVTRTLRLVPTDARCLTQSLVLTELLARRGVSASVVIGVAPGPGFKAHAWVEAGGDVLLPSHEPAFHRLTEI